MHQALSWHLIKIVLFLAHSIVLNFFSFILHDLPFNINNGGILYLEAVTPKTAIILHLSFPLITISIFFYLLYQLFLYLDFPSTTEFHQH